LGGLSSALFVLVTQANQIRSRLEMAKWIRKLEDKNNCNANNLGTKGRRIDPKRVPFAQCNLFQLSGFT